MLLALGKSRENSTNTGKSQGISLGENVVTFNKSEASVVDADIKEYIKGFVCLS